MQALNFVDGSYADDAKPWSSQDVCNWLPTLAESAGTRTLAKHETPPGLKPWVEAGAGVIRGLHNAEGRPFAVIGGTMYQISNNGVAIPLGGIPGTGRCVLLHNQITGGNQVLAVNGSSGYVWNTQAQTFARVTDPGYPGAIDGVFMDGYGIQIEPGRRFAFNSNLADLTDYNTLDRFTSEYSPDSLVGLETSENDLILFSSSTTEFFENVGAARQPFRSKRISFDKGLAATHAVGKVDNTVMWLGSDGMFYMLEGYTPRRISTRPIEQSIRGKNWSQAFAFAWSTSGHSVCYWTFPDGLTWGYDAAVGKWHRRNSYGLDRWRLNSTMYWQQRWFGGDFQRGRIWELDWDYQLEGDVEIEREAIVSVIHDNQTRVVMPRLELLFDMGREPTIPIPFPEQPIGPTITGSAPDGVVGEAYEFTYTVTPGDAAIVSTTIRTGTLLPGLSWDSATATISGTPTQAGAMSLAFRTLDTNGLYDDHTDTILIAALSWLALPFADGNGDPNGKSLHWTDSPTSWSMSPSEIGNGASYYRWVGISGQEVVLVSTVGNRVLHSSNGGASFAEGSTPSQVGGVRKSGDYWWMTQGTPGTTGVTSIMRSEDGLTFSVPDTSNAARLTDAPVYASGVYFAPNAFTNNGVTQVGRSLDGATWAMVDSALNLDKERIDLNPSNSLAIIAGIDGGNALKLMSSATAGASWAAIGSLPFTETTPSGSPFLHYSATLDMWVVEWASEIGYSADGLTGWTLATHEMGAGIRTTGFASGDGYIVASCSDGTFQVTTTGSAWVKVTPSDAPSEMFGVGYVEPP